MGKGLKKKTLKTESTVVRKPKGTPPCPIHHTPMRYDAEHMRWACTMDDCRQVAFPPEQIEQGKPILGRGALEVVRVDDPDGSKAGRTLLRAIDNNVMIDVTDYLYVLDEHSIGCRVTLDIQYLAEQRTRRG